MRERKLWSLKRKGKGITIKEVAEHVDYHFTMISKWELGHKDMSEEKLKLYKEYIENKEIDF